MDSPPDLFYPVPLFRPSLPSLSSVPLFRPSLPSLSSVPCNSCPDRRESAVGLSVGLSAVWWRALRHEVTGGKVRCPPMQVCQRTFTALSLL